MLKLKLQYFGHLMGRVDSLEKTLMLGGIGGRRRRGWQRMRWLDGITDSMDVEFEWTPGDGDGQGGLACCDSWGRKESDTTERLNWTEVYQVHTVHGVLKARILVCHCLLHWKDWCRNWNSNTLATWCEELTHLKRPWCWERLKAGGEGDDRGWDDWMASPTQWTWVWASFESWWWTGKPGMLQSMGSQRVGHNWVTEVYQYIFWCIS